MCLQNNTSAYIITPNAKITVKTSYNLSLVFRYIFSKHKLFMKILIHTLHSMKLKIPTNSPI